LLCRIPWLTIPPVAYDLITLGEVAARSPEMIEIRCGRCDRAGRLSVARRLTEHGPSGCDRAHPAWPSGRIVRSATLCSYRTDAIPIFLTWLASFVFPQRLIRRVHCRHDLAIADRPLLFRRIRRQSFPLSPRAAQPDHDDKVFGSSRSICFQRILRPANSTKFFPTLHEL
jgi:hypothetical protein